MSYGNGIQQTLEVFLSTRRDDVCLEVTYFVSARRQFLKSPC